MYVGGIHINNQINSAGMKGSATEVIHMVLGAEAGVVEERVEDENVMYGDILYGADEMIEN